MALFLKVFKETGIGRIPVVYLRNASKIRWSSSSSSPSPPKADPKNPGLTYHRPNNFEKFLLVWHKRYPSKEEVPDFVPQNTMEKVRNLTRIKVNILMCVLAVIGCFAMIFSGKEAAKRGESVAQMNLDWHKNLGEKK